MMQQAAHLHTHTTSFLPTFSFIRSRHTGPLFYHHTTTSNRVHLCSLYTCVSPFPFLLYSFYFSSLKNNSPPFTLIWSQSLHLSLPFIHSEKAAHPPHIAFSSAPRPLSLLCCLCEYVRAVWVCEYAIVCVWFCVCVCVIVQVCESFRVWAEDHAHIGFLLPLPLSFANPPCVLCRSVFFCTQLYVSVFSVDLWWSLLFLSFIGVLPTPLLFMVFLLSYVFLSLPMS